MWQPVHRVMSEPVNQNNRDERHNASAQLFPVRCQLLVRRTGTRQARKPGLVALPCTLRIDVRFTSCMPTVP